MRGYFVKIYNKKSSGMQATCPRIFISLLFQEIRRTIHIVLLNQLTIEVRIRICYKGTNIFTKRRVQCQNYPMIP